MIDGGARLLGRVLPIGRGWRVAIVLLLTAAVPGLARLCSPAAQIAAQAARAAGDRSTTQARRAARLAAARRASRSTRPTSRTSPAGWSAASAPVTRAIGGVFGALTTLFLIVVIGIYVALEPRLYERGVAWMLPREQRALTSTTPLGRMACTMRRLMAGRLLGMVVEGVAHLDRCCGSTACRWRRCSACSPACSPSSPTSAR